MASTWRFLNQHGSLFVTRPKLFDYYATPEDRSAGSTRLFELLAQGVLKPEIGQRFAPAGRNRGSPCDRIGQGLSGATLLMP